MSSIQQEDILPGQILQAALQLYQKQGLKKVTMDDVAKAIGKTRSALYYYYKNRDDIFEAVMAKLIAEVIGEIGTAIDQAGTTEQKIRTFCLTKVKTSESRQSFFKAIEAGMDVDEISRHANLMSDIHKRMMQEEKTLLKSVFADGIKADDIRALKPKEQDMLIFILQSGIRGIRRELLHEGSFSRLPAAVETLTGMAMAWLKDER